MSNEDMVIKLGDAHLEPPEDPEPIQVCEYCGRGLYAGDWAYTINGDFICADCMNDQYGTMIS